MNPKAFVFFGRSGCGKGTQAKLLKEHLEKDGSKVIYIETGSTFRELAKADNLLGKNIHDILKNGLLIPVFLPIWIWTRIVVENFTGKEHMILDGVCRRLEEAVALDSLFDFYHIETPNIILINVSKEWSYDRMMERKRPDDSPETIKNRLEWFERDAVPSMEYFKKRQDFNFVEINGEQPIAKVHQDIKQALGY